MARKNWSKIRDRRLRSEAARTGYERARRAFELGGQVRRLRETKSMSQSELARRIGSTQPAVARLEAGGVAPRLETLERIAGALGLELVVEFAGPPSGPRRAGRAKAAARTG
jgi:transcriptional regulator with XRE-family HTH domain